MQRTKIQYLDYTWNPIAMRCTSISSGCANCWHLAMAKRLAGNKLLSRKERRAYSGDRGPVLKIKELSTPLYLKKPARIGVQFMGDLFHESIKFEIIKQVLMNAANSKRHFYLFLTKRPLRMAECMRWFQQFAYQGEDGYINIKIPDCFWLGVSVEDQKTADEKIPILLQIPANYRFISIEPMLESITLAHYIPAPVGLVPKSQTLNWIILGGETGPKARLMQIEWVRSVRDQCQAAGVPFFFKGWGDHEKRYNKGSRYDSTNTGRLLDGREYSEMPIV